MRFVYKSGKLFISVLLISLIAWAAEREYRSAKLKRTNFLNPLASELFVAEIQDGQSSDPRVWRQCRFYYKNLTDHRRDLAEAWGLLGYCSFQEGYLKEAIEAYQKASELNPTFFWFHHNLAVLYFKNGESDRAEKALEQALGSSPALSMQFILSSKRVYKPLLQIRGMENPDQILLELKQAYQRSSLSPDLSQAKLGFF